MKRLIRVTNVWERGDIAVITGVPMYMGAKVNLLPGEVVEVQTPVDAFGGVWATGRWSRKSEWIDASALTPFDDISLDTDVDWGLVHDYVWEGEE